MLQILLTDPLKYAPDTPNLGFISALSNVQLLFSIDTNSSFTNASDVEYWSTPAFVR